MCHVIQAGLGMKRVISIFRGFMHRCTNLRYLRCVNHGKGALLVVDEYVVVIAYDEIAFSLLIKTSSA